jgi:hypothetical protein
VSRRDIVRIARRFNVGNVEHNAPSPEGTAESRPLQPHHFSRPFGTRHSWLVRPSVKNAGLLSLVPPGPIRLAPKERWWERGVYAASTHDCQQATDCSNSLLLATLKRRERRAPLYTYSETARLRQRLASFRNALLPTQMFHKRRHSERALLNNTHYDAAHYSGHRS